MNFLAHAFLSGDDEEILIGNFVADAIKGKSVKTYSEGIQKGIELHRSIDTFTDKHPVFQRSRDRILEKHGKFSGVIIDIYYDHFLAANWEDWSEKDLSEFALEVYEVMLRNYKILPPRSKRILPYMIIHNWLVGYSRFKDLQWVFNGMSRRSKKYESGMETAIESLKEHYDSFKLDFEEFFPDMIHHASEVRHKLLGTKN